MHFHDLRHEAISRLFEKGLSVPEVALISGHRDVRMLFRYTHMSRKAIHDKLREPGSGSPVSKVGIWRAGSQEVQMRSLGAKEQQIMSFLHERIFDPILASPIASARLKQGVRYTIMRLEERDAGGMVQYYWSAIIGTERSIGFAAQMRQEGFDRFEEALEEFRVRFDDRFLSQR